MDDLGLIIQLWIVKLNTQKFGIFENLGQKHVTLKMDGSINGMQFMARIPAVHGNTILDSSLKFWAPLKHRVLGQGPFEVYSLYQYYQYTTMRHAFKSCNSKKALWLPRSGHRKTTDVPFGTSRSRAACCCCTRTCREFQEVIKLRRFSKCVLGHSRVLGVL